VAVGNQPKDKQAFADFHSAVALEMDAADPTCLITMYNRVESLVLVHSLIDKNSPNLKLHYYTYLYRVDELFPSICSTRCSNGCMEFSVM